MKRFALFVVLLMTIAAAGAAAPTEGYTVSGRVIDRITREGIPYAVVLIVGIDG